MGAFIDGVQRRGPILAPVSVPIPVPARQPRPLTAGRPVMDGLINRVVAPAMPLSAPALPSSAAIAEPLAPATSWYGTVAVAATISVALGSIGLEAGNLHLERYLALPRLATTAKPAVITHVSAPTPTKPADHLIATQKAMQSVLDQKAASADVPTGLMAIDLKTGATAASNADTVFTSASIYKLFVATAVYQRIDNSTLNPSSTVPGTGMNVSSCLNSMVTVSSNFCGEALGSLVGWDSQNIPLHAAGFNHTLLRQNDSEQTSASDVALLLQRLYKGELLSASSTASFIGLLKNQQINDRLPAGLPAGTTVAHKTGDLNGLAHDAGIVYAPAGDYIIVAMSGPWNSTTQAYSWMSGLSDSLYASLSSIHATR